MEGINFKNGAEITQKWKCFCDEKFTHRNYKWIKTDMVEKGRKYSRSQPELNIRIVKSAREVGVNFEKTVDFLANIGVKTGSYQNIFCIRGERCAMLLKIF